MTDIPVALPVRTHIREYEIQELVGSGGFGFVYRATDHTLQRSVALKEYFPASIATRGEDGLVQSRLSAQNGIYKRGLEGFLTEARVLAQFDDPAVVKVHFFWEQDGTAYMVMPFYDGITLRGLVRHHQDLITVEWLTAFILRITDVLGRLHDAGTYHRDLSPENILILQSGGLVLLDFGSSRQVLAGLAGGNDVVLKPGYAPIEQYLEDDSLKQGPWTDLYGLGAVLHFLLEGKAPPASINRMQQDAYELLLGKRDHYPEVPPKILAGIDYCLAVQPDRRPQSVAKLKELFAISPDRMPEDFDLYQGVARSTEFAATSTIYDENDLTIPLDPIAVMSQEVKSGFLAIERSTGTAVPGLSQPPQNRVAEVEVSADSDPITWRGDNNTEKNKVVSKPVTAKAQSRQVQAVVGLVSFVLLCSVALWLYLSISPPWKRAIVPAQAVLQLKPSSSLETQAGVQTGFPNSGAIALQDPMPETGVTPPARTEFPVTAGTAPVPIKQGGTPEVPRSDIVKLPASPPVDHGPVNPKLVADAAATIPQQAATGVLRLNIKPWGKLSINGQPRGASPPLKQIKLAPGKYQIEISNPGFSSYSRELEVMPGATTVIKHYFE